MDWLVIAIRPSSTGINWTYLWRVTEGELAGSSNRARTASLEAMKYLLIGARTYFAEKPDHMKNVSVEFLGRVAIESISFRAQALAVYPP